MMRLRRQESIREEVQLLVCEISEEVKKNIPHAKVEEIGSTAIPGSVTKGDVDLLVLVEENEFNFAENVLVELYEVNEMEKIELFASFKGNRHGIEFGLQLTTPNSKNFGFIEFRDILRKSPKLVEEYNAVKLKAINLCEDEYRARKNEFIEMVLQKNA